MINDLRNWRWNIDHITNNEKTLVNHKSIGKIAFGLVPLCI